MPAEDGKAPPPEIITPEELRQIPEDLRPRIEVLVRRHSVEMFNSPLLPPEVLARYDNVVPGLAAKLIAWTEEETRHRREMERAGFQEVRTLRSRSQISGPLVAIVGILAAAWLITTANSFPASVVGSVMVIASVGGPFAARLLASRWTQQKPSAGGDDAE